MKKHIKIIIACLIPVLLGTNIYRCSTSHQAPRVVTTTVTHTDTIRGDSVPYLVTVKQPYPVFVDTGMVNTPVVDTMGIIKKYLARNIYYRVLKDDSSAFVAIGDTVFCNRLLSGTMVFQNRRATAINTTTTTVQPIKEDVKTWHLYVGMSGAYCTKTDSIAKIGLSPNIGFQNKKGHIITYGYDVLLKTHHAGMLFNLK